MKPSNQDIFNNFVFDSGSWTTIFRYLRYPINIIDLDLSTLERERVIPSNYKKEIISIKRFYKDDYVEYVIIDTRKITRSRCIDIAKQWKRNRLIRPFLIFTDKSNRESLLIIIPGRGITTDEIRTLHISDTFYHTDKEVIKALQYDSNIKDRYDKEFLPYEKVRDEFFEEYRALYEKIVNGIKSLNLNLNSDKFKPTEYAQRFLGRLMFLYFLQRKGWLNGDKRFIDKIKDFHELNEIFYEGLNKSDNVKGLPYLNGSLFEKEEYMTDDFEKRLAEVMDQIFKEARSIFNKYNFTVDESLEKEVSLDPLLLGTILENMLPEQERGKKGTFYTPVKEIEFMCRRAIANYLGLEDRVNVKDDGSYEFIDGLDEYIKSLKDKNNGEKERAVRELRNKILELKVLDPAVGSGGFLVVMMKVMIDIIHKAEELIGIRSDPVELKKKIIPNLYGFDIEYEAVEIARLRLWLSLIIDQKYPEPLPNLDLTMEKIEDSLNRPNKQILLHTYMDTEISKLRARLDELYAKYVNEHTYEKKKELKKDIDDIKAKIGKYMKTNIDIIEKYLPRNVDIVVMNPPYVRQEDIDKKKKEEYTTTYNLARTSDIYCYFMLRALDLINDNGVVCTITSDKWLETSYGESLQEKLKPHLIAIYGQRERSFTADINTVITVYKKSTDKDTINFIYLESYSPSANVIHYVSLKKSSLKEGRWYYLKAPKVFIDKLLPKLDKRLKDLCEIKFGVKTGANEFFYMKDISHLFNADRLSYPNRFNYLSSNITTEHDLKAHNLIYIKNEGDDTFVIDAKDVKPLIRTPKEIRSYHIPKPTTLCLYTSNPGKFTKMYIKYGESKDYHNRSTCKNRNPWYKLADLKPSRILLPMSWMDTIYIPISKEDIICDARLYLLYPKDNSIDVENLWLYLNSTLFYLTAELYGRRLGGGAIDIKVEDYEEIPIPDLSKIKIEYDHSSLLRREPLIYHEEVMQQDRIELDKAVLRTLGFNENELDSLVKALHKAFIEVVEDRLIKADRPLKRLSDGNNGKKDSKE